MTGHRLSARALLLTATSAAGFIASQPALAQQTSTTQGVIANEPASSAASPSAQASDAAVPVPADNAADEIVVTGIRASQERAISIKRNAPSVVDAISAEDIGKLPDVTIADSLQRIPGVQIRREAGEGAAINIRGLPQVTTLLNGEAYLGANSISSIQPNFNDIPSQLFAGADVIKSTTADLLNAGITGTVNLRTRRPFDLKHGLTVAATAQGDYGDKTKHKDPNLNGLVGYHSDRFGALLSAAYSDVRLANLHNGIQEGYGAGVHDESAADATSGTGFSPNNRPRGTRLIGANGAITGVDVNGDGDAKDVFLTPQTFTSWDKETERKRLGINGSVQAEFSDALEFTADGFFTKQTQYDRTAGIQSNQLNWQAGEYIPTASRDTGVTIPRSGGAYNLNTVQVYQYDLPNFDSYSESIRTKSQSQNYNAQLKWDNGGKFTATIRGIYGKAHQNQNQSYTQFNLSNGFQWQPNGVGHYPAALGGDRAFNPNGYLVNSLAGLNSLQETIDFSHNQPIFTLPQQLTAELGDINNYALKTISSENNFRKKGTLKLVRADGEYKLSDNFNVEFGARYSDRHVTDDEFERAAPLYAGQGASNPNGCLVKWKAFDVNLGDAVCTAGDTTLVNGVSTFRPYTAGLTRKATDQSFGGKVKKYHLPGSGLPDVYVLDPHAQDDAVAFQNSFYPGNVETQLPGRSYGVGVKQTSGYVQANFNGDIGLPISGNFGVRVIQTKLNIQQNLTGSPRPYGVAPLDIGDVITKRDFTDVLPAVNVALDVSPKLKLRFAYTKTMTLLDLNQWGGGLDLNYALNTSSGLFEIQSGNSNGNPKLDPWRADNFDLSAEYYIGKASLISLAFFYIDVQSFIQNGTTTRNDLPDNDGVVRGRTVVVNTPVQGSGGTLKGFELGWKQSFGDLGFLPGFLSDFGIDANFTYSPSKSGDEDLAGRSIPFQDNSKIQTNAALYYQGGGLQARVAWNYRSKRAVQTNYAGLTGLELYQRPTNYIDASVSYDVTPNVTVFAQGSNLTGEYEKYYLTFTDERAYNNIYERRYSAGVRVKF